MKRHRVVFRPEAFADLRDIYGWVFRVSQNPVTADGFTSRIVQACEKVGDAPFGGRPRDDLLPGLRLTPFERRAVIAYLVEGETVHVTNIFYGGRDYDALYRSAEDWSPRDSEDDGL